MTTVQRRRAAAGVVLAAAAVVAVAYVVGQPARDGTSKIRLGGVAPAASGADVIESLVTTKFTGQPLLTYKTKDGDTLFAWQLQPKLPAAPARPRDVLVLVDTSASQAAGPLDSACKLTEALVAKLGDDDRVAIWTTNTKTADLTRGFQSPRRVEAALKALKAELPIGATDLRSALTDVVKAFEGKADRQQVVLYMGDGMSILNPIGSKELPEIGDKLAGERVAFFPVPMGLRMDPLMLHGLASHTGGSTIRFTVKEQPGEIAQRVLDTVAAPVLYPTSLVLSDEVVEHYPAGKLPPVRADQPTLVVGKMKPGKQLKYTLKGTVGGQDVTLSGDQAVSEPETGNFFLASMVKQWQEAKDQPALVRADRALAFVEEQTLAARDEYLSQGEWALAERRYDAAAKLFEQAQQINPADVEAAGLAEMAANLRDGKITLDQLREKMKATSTKRTRVRRGPGNQVVREDVLVRAQPEPGAAPPGVPGGPGEPPAAPPPTGQDLLEEAKRRQAVEDQRSSQIVDDALRQAQRTLVRDPDAAYDYLKRTLDGVRTNPDLSDRTRAALVNRLEAALTDSERRGQVIKQDIASRQEALARAQARIGVENTRAALETRIRERMRVFHNLMDQARQEEAFKQANALRRDLVDQGVAIPQAVTAAYIQSLASFHLAELTELRRMREERYLRAMLGVERSAIPFPDEWVIRFPTERWQLSSGDMPGLTWRELTELRKGRYEAMAMPGEDPQAWTNAKRVQNTLRTPVTFKGFDDPKTKLGEALTYLQDAWGDLEGGRPFDITVWEEAFQAAGVKDVLETEIGMIPKMPNVSMSTVLQRIISALQTKLNAGELTYLIRNNTVEIATKQAAAADKVVRAYPVADLVVPIPSSFNQNSLLQAGSLFGAFGAQGVAGALGAAGIGGLGFNQFVGVAGNLGGAVGVAGFGGLAGVGGLGGALGAAGLGGGLGGGMLGPGGALGAAGALGALGQQGVQGGVNLGVGGGVVGVGGGQLGQFGNLGGQFGLQGGTTQNILTQLITQLIAPGEWGALSPFDQVGTPTPPGGIDEPATVSGDKNMLAYYPPTLALVVRGTSRLHTNPRPPIRGGMGPPQGALDKPREEAVVQAKPGAVKPRDPRVAAAGGELDPKVIWQQALAKGVDDPGLIIACADFLAGMQMWDHAAEFLKATVKQGIVVRPWVYEALAVALRETKASPDEIERAEVSAADLEPMNPDAYLKAAEAMKELKRYDRAVAFCKQAALLEPTQAGPYKDALVYADLGKDQSGMEWAASNLLQRDWPKESRDLHRQARTKLEDLAGTLEKENRKAEAERLLAAVRKEQVRDLEVRLVWQDPADLDLKIEEPVGSVCSWLNRQTVGGGLLQGDRIPDAGARTFEETYVAARAFPGEYKITVDRVWGRPLGDKAQLRILRHKGTPQEQEEIVTLDLQAKRSVTVKLDNGRRTEAAEVPPPTMPVLPAEDEGSNRPGVLDQMYSLVNPEASTGVPGIRGGFSFSGSSPPVARIDRPARADMARQTAVQTVLPSVARNTADVTADVALTADRRFLRFSFNPVFDTLAAKKADLAVRSPFIPGGDR